MSDTSSTKHTPIHPDALAFLAQSPKQLFIGGEWIPAESGRTFSTISPIDGQHLADVAEADQVDIDKAVTAARAAFNRGDWANANPDQRTQYLLNIAQAIRTHREALAALESLDNGMPLHDSLGQIDYSASLFDYYAGWTTKQFGKTNPSEQNLFSYTRREPLGVVGAIIPWNVPFVNVSLKIAPALATGNSIVLKTAEDTPLSALYFAQILQTVDLPKGLVNIVTGYGHTAGAEIANHTDVNKVSFTGSLNTGRSLIQASTNNLKKLTLELGGKSPFIIFDDADLEKAIQYAVISFTANAGQMCVAGSRIFIQDSIFSEVSAKIAAQAAALTIGHPFDPSTVIGPMASTRHLEKVKEYIAIGQAQGANIISPAAEDLKGNYLRPVVFTDVTPEMRIYQEEIFGPVAILVPFSDEADALAKANDTEFGLAAGLWTKNLDRAIRISAGLQAGSVWVNSYYEASSVTPFGGYKLSGLGREFGEESLDAYTQIKSVAIRLG